MLCCVAFKIVKRLSSHTVNPRGISVFTCSHGVDILPNIYP